MNYINFVNAVQNWAAERGILDLPPEKQIVVLLGEIDELKREVFRKDKAATQMEWADCMVVLAVLATMLDINPEQAFRDVMEKLNKRKKGKIVDGKWTKQEN